MSPGNSPGTPPTKKRYPAYTYHKGKSLKDYLSNRGKSRQQKREGGKDVEKEHCSKVKFIVDENNNDGKISDVVTVAIGDEMELVYNDVIEEEIVGIPNLSYEEETPNDISQEINLNIEKRGDVIEHSNEDYREIIEIPNDDYRDIIEQSKHISEELQNRINNEVQNNNYQEIIEIKNDDYREIIEQSKRISEDIDEKREPPNRIFKVKKENDFVEKIPANNNNFTNTDTFSRNLDLEENILGENLNTKDTEFNENLDKEHVVFKEYVVVKKKNIEEHLSIKGKDIEEELETEEINTNSGNTHLDGEKEIDFKTYKIVEESDFNGQSVLNDVEFQTIQPEEDTPCKRIKIDECVFVNKTNKQSDEEQASDHNDEVSKNLNQSDSLILHRETKSTNQIAREKDSCNNQANGDSGFLTELFTKRDRNQSPIKTKEATG